MMNLYPFFEENCSSTAFVNFEFMKFSCHEDKSFIGSVWRCFDLDANDTLQLKALFHQSADLNRWRIFPYKKIANEGFPQEKIEASKKSCLGASWIVRAQLVCLATEFKHSFLIQFLFNFALIIRHLLVSYHGLNDTEWNCNLVSHHIDVELKLKFHKSKT